MLQLFEVSGFRGFNEKVALDFSDVRDYQYNSNCIADNLISKMIIYGKNAIGKSNFGAAMLDISPRHPFRRPSSGFTSDEESVNDVTYLNTQNVNDYAEFRYRFRFGDNYVDYTYRKKSSFEFTYEKLKLDNQILFEYDKNYPNESDVSGISHIFPTLILPDYENVKSMLFYLLSNVALESAHPLRKTSEFIDEMLMLRSSDVRFSRYFSAPMFIKQDGVLEEFESFLYDTGVTEKLVLLKDNDDRERLYFNTTPPLPFFQVASSGTKTLFDFFVVYKHAKLNNTSLLFVDEFDLFYHFELAEKLVKMLEKLDDTQVIITSHNTKLLTNRIMRPDCYFIMTKDKLTSLANATHRELREGHNLEKLYMSGEFNG